MHINKICLNPSNMHQYAKSNLMYKISLIETPNILNPNYGAYTLYEYTMHTNPVSKIIHHHISAKTQYLC